MCTFKNSTISSTLSFKAVLNVSTMRFTNSNRQCKLEIRIQRQDTYCPSSRKPVPQPRNSPSRSTTLSSTDRTEITRKSLNQATSLPVQFPTFSSMQRESLDSQTRPRKPIISLTPLVIQPTKPNVSSIVCSPLVWRRRPLNNDQMQLFRTIWKFKRHCNDSAS